MGWGIARKVVKIGLIRLGSCRSAIELRPKINDLGGVGLALWLPFRCHVRESDPASRRFISFETPPSNRLGIDDNETMSTVRAPSIPITAPYPMAMALRCIADHSGAGPISAFGGKAENICS